MGDNDEAEATREFVRQAIKELPKMNRTRLSTTIGEGKDYLSDLFWGRKQSISSEAMIAIQALLDEHRRSLRESAVEAGRGVSANRVASPPDKNPSHGTDDIQMPLRRLRQSLAMAALIPKIEENGKALLEDRRAAKGIADAIISNLKERPDVAIVSRPRVSPHKPAGSEATARAEK